MLVDDRCLRNGCSIHTQHETPPSNFTFHVLTKYQALHPLMHSADGAHARDSSHTCLMLRFVANAVSKPTHIVSFLLHLSSTQPDRHRLISRRQFRQFDRPRPTCLTYTFRPKPQKIPSRLHNTPAIAASSMRALELGLLLLLSSLLAADFSAAQQLSGLLSSGLAASDALAPAVGKQVSFCSLCRISLRQCPWIPCSALPCPICCLDGDC